MQDRVKPFEPRAPATLKQSAASLARRRAKLAAAGEPVKGEAPALSLYHRRPAAYGILQRQLVFYPLGRDGFFLAGAKYSCNQHLAIPPSGGT